MLWIRILKAQFKNGAPIQGINLLMNCLCLCTVFYGGVVSVIEGWVRHIEKSKIIL